MIKIKNLGGVDPAQAAAIAAAKQLPRRAADRYKEVCAYCADLRKPRAV